MIKKFAGLTEEEYIAECRLKFHESVQDKQTKLAFKRQIQEMATKLTAQNLDTKAAFHLCEALNLIIRCSLNIRRISHLQAEDIPKAQKIVNQIFDILSSN